MNANATARNRPPEGAARERAESRIDESRRRRFILSEAVRVDVIPHLLGQRGVVSREALSVSEEQIIEIARLALGSSDGSAAAYVTDLLERGHAAESLYLDLLSPAAALLGQYWVDDRCNFADVTIGMLQLQQAMRAMGSAFFGSHTLLTPAGPRTLLMPLPGEQHTFGLSMLSDFFRRAGWNTWSGTVTDSFELQRMVSSEWVDMVGFSLACDEAMDTARREIKAVRAVSRNKAIVVMIGGPPFLDNEALADLVGADGTARDGLQAVSVAQLLVTRQRRAQLA